MKLRFFGLLALVPFLGFTPANALTLYTYDVSLTTTIGAGVPETVGGTIVTTCDNSCALNSGDISSFSLSVTGTYNGVIAGTEADTSPQPLSANSTNIVFSSATGYNLFEDPSGSSLAFDTGGTIVLDVVISGVTHTSYLIATTPFDIATIAATPLPAALPLFGAGLGLIALLALRRKQKRELSILSYFAA